MEPNFRKGKPAKDRKYLEQVKSLPCCVCGKAPPSDAHHACGYEFSTGMGRKASDYDAIPLCKDHHQFSPVAFHVLEKDAWEKLFGTQQYHVNETRRILGK